MTAESLRPGPRGSDQSFGDSGSDGTQRRGSAVPRPWNASMIPQTVPNNPMKGVTAPVMASQGTLRSMR